MIRMLAGLMLILWPALASGATIGDCNGPAANARYLATPADEAVRTFRNGEIAFVGLYREAEAPRGARLMVLYPAPEDAGQRCVLIADESGDGFAYVAIARAVAVSDEQQMIRVEVPVGMVAAQETHEQMLEVRIDPTTGDFDAGIAP